MRSKSQRRSGRPKDTAAGHQCMNEYGELTTEDTEGTEGKIEINVGHVARSVHHAGDSIPEMGHVEIQE